METKYIIFCLSIVVLISFIVYSLFQKNKLTKIMNSNWILSSITKLYKIILENIIIPPISGVGFL